MENRIANIILCLIKLGLNCFNLQKLSLPLEELRGFPYIVKYISFVYHFENVDNVENYLKKVI
jgi:hypothetical protein